MLVLRLLLSVKQLKQVRTGAREHHAVRWDVVTPHGDDDVAESAALAQSVEVRERRLTMLRVVEDEHRLRVVIVVSHRARSPVNQLVDCEIICQSINALLDYL